ncbi:MULTISPECIES: hypothetical protein [unclassified Thiocapsa]|uniref:hypothetical protein n=1 Tax=unclassified Thiocapsa TaxID=2641286 RepID=UPI0035ADEEF1
MLLEPAGVGVGARDLRLAGVFQRGDPRGLGRLEGGELVELGGYRARRCRLGVLAGVGEVEFLVVPGDLALEGGVLALQLGQGLDARVAGVGVEVAAVDAEALPADQIKLAAQQDELAVGRLERLGGNFSKSSGKETSKLRK